LLTLGRPVLQGDESEQKAKRVLAKSPKRDNS